jgi:hypothetical protein
VVCLTLCVCVTVCVCACVCDCVTMSTEHAVRVYTLLYAFCVHPSLTMLRATPLSCGAPAVCLGITSRFLACRFNVIMTMMGVDPSHLDAYFRALDVSGQGAHVRMGVGWVWGEARVSVAWFGVGAAGACMAWFGVGAAGACMARCPALPTPKVRLTVPPPDRPPSRQARSLSLSSWWGSRPWTRTRCTGRPRCGRDCGSLSACMMSTKVGGRSLWCLPCHCVCSGVCCLRSMGCCW